MKRALDVDRISFAPPFRTRNFLALAACSASLLHCRPQPPTLTPPADPVVAVPPEPREPTKKPKAKRDADQQAAQLQMLNSSFGYGTDKDNQARFPLPDRRNWKRVRFSMIEHFTGFVYGEEDHSMVMAVVVPLKEGDPQTSAACVQRFEENARTQVSEMGGRMNSTATVMRRWHKIPLTVRTATGEVDVLFKHYKAALAWTGYPAYPGHCMVYAVVIPWREDPTLALQLREQWLDAFRKFRPLTETAPYRH